MNKLILLLVYVVAVVFVSCSGSESETSLKLKKGTYDYTMTDSSGNKIVTGMLKIDSLVKSTVPDLKSTYNLFGSYTVNYLTTDTSFTSLTTLNSGIVTGYYDDAKKTVGINTNPRIADANIFWQADVSSKDLKGYWYFSSFRGTVKEGGYFNAKKK
jgi:hypothetical protein